MSAPVLISSEREMTRLVSAINQLGQGRSSAVGTLTLTAGATSTTVTAPNCGAGCKVFLMPTTANAAAAVASTYIDPDDVTKEQFIVTHANNSQTDRTFFYVAFG